MVTNINTLIIEWLIEKQVKYIELIRDFNIIIEEILRTTEFDMDPITKDVLIRDLADKKILQYLTKYNVFGLDTTEYINADKIFIGKSLFNNLQKHHEYHDFLHALTVLYYSSECAIYNILSIMNNQKIITTALDPTSYRYKLPSTLIFCNDNTNYIHSLFRDEKYLFVEKIKYFKNITNVLIVQTIAVFNQINEQ